MLSVGVHCKQPVYQVARGQNAARPMLVCTEVTWQHASDKSHTVLAMQNCQYWLSKSTQDPSVLWLIAEHFAPELFYHFWPGCNIDGAPNEVSSML